MTDVVATDTEDFLPHIRSLIGKLELEATVDSKSSTYSIMERILAAETEEEIFDAQEAGSIGSKDHTLQPFRLQASGIEWKKSGQVYIDQGGFPYYALLHVTDIATGEELVINAGGPSVVSVLSNLLSLDGDERPIEKRPFERYREEGGRPLQFVPKPVASGFSVILLRPVKTDSPGVAESKSSRGRKS